MIVGGGAQRVGRHPGRIDRDADDLGAARLEQVEQRREGRILDRDPVAEADQHPGRQLDAVHRAVDHGELVRGERPLRRAASRPARAAPDRRGSCRAWRHRSARPARGTGRAAAQDRGRRWTGRGGRRCCGRARAGSAGWPGAAGRPPSCRAGRRCGSCRSGRAAPTRRSPSSARRRARPATVRIAGSRAPGSSAPSRIARLTAVARPRADSSSSRLSTSRSDLSIFVT